MKVIKTPLEGFLSIEPDLFEDERGFFLETYHEDRYNKVGIFDKFIQGNHSRSSKGVLRGMHYQIKKPQAQIVTIMYGKVFYVCVDLRVNSSNFGKWHGIELSDNGIMQLYMAPGLAGGFCVLSPIADLHYSVSGFYDPDDEGGVLWNDPDISIEWPISSPTVNFRDSQFSLLKDIASNKLPSEK
jgi:dTDP-4-dehydrorhamnose 3,5-epimerase